MRVSEATMLVLAISSAACSVSQSRPETQFSPSTERRLSCPGTECAGVVLGRAFDSATAQFLPGSCLTPASKKEISSEASTGKKDTVNIFSTTSELLKSESLSLAAELGVGIFSASATYRAVSSTTSRSTADYMLAEVLAQRSSERFDGKPKLGSEYGRLELMAFRSQCGDYYVSEIVRGGELRLLMTATTTDQQSRASVQAAFKAAYGSQKAEVAIDKLESLSTQTASLTIEADQKPEIGSIPQGFLELKEFAKEFGGKVPASASNVIVVKLRPYPERNTADLYKLEARSRDLLLAYDRARRFEAVMNGVRNSPQAYSYAVDTKLVDVEVGAASRRKAMLYDQLWICLNSKSDDAGQCSVPECEEREAPVPRTTERREVPFFDVMLCGYQPICVTGPHEWLVVSMHGNWRASNQDARQPEFRDGANTTLRFTRNGKVIEHASASGARGRWLVGPNTIVEAQMNDNICHDNDMGAPHPYASIESPVLLSLSAEYGSVEEEFREAERRP